MRSPRSGTNVLLRLEGLVLFLASTFFYSQLPEPAGWLIYLLVFFLPDLSMLGYLGGPKMGALSYNAVHTTIGPLLLAFAAYAASWPLALDASAIWLAHLGFDRALGYGLKHRTAFNDTHLTGT